MRIVFLLISILIISGCTNEEKTISLLESEGYQNIETTGFRLLGCIYEDDFNRTGFIAEKDGKRVSGAVCYNPYSFRSPTISLD